MNSQYMAIVELYLGSWNSRHTATRIDVRTMHSERGNARRTMLPQPIQVQRSKPNYQFQWFWFIPVLQTQSKSEAANIWATQLPLYYRGIFQNLFLLQNICTYVENTRAKFEHWFKHDKAHKQVKREEYRYLQQKQGFCHKINRNGQ